jgi:hypothetical protein
MSEVLFPACSQQWQTADYEMVHVSDAADLDLVTRELKLQQRPVSLDIYSATAEMRARHRSCKMSAFPFAAKGPDGVVYTTITTMTRALGGMYNQGAWKVMIRWRQNLLHSIR